MGQSHGRSSSELLYDVACIGNVEAIKALWREGASLEWTDCKGRTPLIVACMDPELVGVAETLIELGANVNAYCPGRQAGTPLHHAAKRALKPSVLLLLSHGANALERNEDGQTPLDVARTAGRANIVRIIENHVCYFSGWLSEFYGPGFLETLMPQLLSRKIWAVVVPFESKDSKIPLKMELVIYSTLQNARPRLVIALWKAKIEETKFQETNSAFVIFDEGTGTRYKFSAGIKGDKEQLQQLYTACMGIPQVMPSDQASTTVAASETAAGFFELAKREITLLSDRASLNLRPRSELLYDVVHIGNVEVIKILWREGASLEWTDGQGRTPLMVACMDPKLLGVVETLIELGANVNAYCGKQAGTPLHHAAKTGLKQSVLLLLSHGAKALTRNEDGQTPLDVARRERHAHIVRIIENHLCYFSGWMWRLNGSGFLGAFLSTKDWAVVVPLGSEDSKMPLKMELFLYYTLQCARPHSVIALWKAEIEEPKFQETNPELIIFDEAARIRYRLAAGSKDDKEQRRRLYNACMGIPLVLPPPVQASTPVAASEIATEAAAADSPVPSNACQTSKQIHTTDFVPSAPPIPEQSFDEGPTYNSSFNFSQGECSNPPGEYGASEVSDTKDEESSSSCTICFEAPLEVACVPCGHLAGCLTCLKEIEAKKGVCPLCRVKIDKVLRIYGV